MTGRRGWYLVFQSEYDTTEGILGPYLDRGQANSAMGELLRAEQYAVELVDDDHPLALYPYFYHHVKVLDLNEHELQVLDREPRREDPRTRALIAAYRDIRDWLDDQPVTASRLSRTHDLIAETLRVMGVSPLAVLEGRA